MTLTCRCEESMNFGLHRELLLIMMSARGAQRGEIFQVADVFKAQVMDVGFDPMSLELTGSTEKIDDFIALLQAYGVMKWREVESSPWSEAGRSRFREARAASNRLAANAKTDKRRKRN
jgi:acetolactate synthase small subunit